MNHREHPNVHMLPLKHSKNTVFLQRNAVIRKRSYFLIIGVFYSR